MCSLSIIIIDSINRTFLNHQIQHTVSRPATNKDMISSRRVIGSSVELTKFSSKVSSSRSFSKPVESTSASLFRLIAWATMGLIKPCTMLNGFFNLSSQNSARGQCMPKRMRNARVFCASVKAVTKREEGCSSEGEEVFAVVT